jgi:uncharacterized membrane protein SpoIIM required for sporulation
VTPFGARPGQFVAGVHAVMTSRALAVRMIPANVRARVRADIGAVAFTALVIGALCAVGAMTGGLPVQSNAAGTASADRSLATFSEILLRNTAAATGLVTGVVTGGVTALGMAVVVSLYFGIVVRAGYDVMGTGETWAVLLPFAPFELLGIAAATVAGVLPVTRAARAAARVGCRPSPIALAYLQGVRDAWWWVALAGALLVLAAALETVVGVPRPSIR